MANKKPQAAKLSKFVMRQCCDRFKNEDHAPECGDTPVRQAVKPSPLPSQVEAGPHNPTQTPWAVKFGHGAPWIVGPDYREGAGMGPICRMDRDYVPDTEHANSEFIVRAVNAHAGLVEALRAVTEALADESPCVNEVGTPVHDALILARVALRAAGEEV